MDFIEQQFYDNYLKAESEIFFQSLINSIRMLHSVNLTNDELQAAGAFLILPDRGIFSVNDYLAVTIQDVEGKLTKSQVFFTMVNVNTAETMRGVRKGYAMVKIKRTKNPLPKVDDAETVEETEEETK